ncbi:transposase family protein [Streptomyces sp. H10-C2]|nr:MULTISPECIES: transposase family protein [unclassified Streptomyces]MDJ0346795.1 transposase family protein [Streptomyces sp. PH10-H1]MDJ0374375.1 transposase family protein [Streptomyces sp. H10-C2]
MTRLILDGTLIESDRVAGVRENGNDLWFSQKHKSFGGNVQFLSAPDGTPLWVSDVEPGSTPDITAARTHALPALYKAAAAGLPTLADKGYIGAGIGILVPVRRPKGRTEQALCRSSKSSACHWRRSCWSDSLADTRGPASSAIRAPKCSLEIPHRAESPRPRGPNLTSHSDAPGRLVVSCHRGGAPTKAGALAWRGSSYRV